MPIPAGSGAPPAVPGGPLYYDPVLSRVRLSLSGLTVEDPFTRSVSGSWGTAPTGQVWTTSGGAPSDSAVTGTVGRQTHTAVNTQHYALVEASSPDVTVTADVTIALGSASGGLETNWALGRASDTSNYYAARLDLGVGTGMTLVLVKRVGGTLSGYLASAAAGTHTGGATWRIKLDVGGSTIRAKAWLTSGVEPASWQVEVTDTDLTSGTLAGVASRFEAGNTNTLPQNIDWDNITVTPTVTVERSTDQVRWTTVRGGVVVPAGGAIRVDDYEFSPDVTNYYRAARYVGSLVPALGGVWLKSLARPFLNREVTVRDFSEVSRPSRGGVFEVVGRPYPVAVTDVRGSRRWTLQVSTDNPQDANNLDLLLAGGDILLVHVPQAAGRISAVPGGYVTVGDTREVTPPTFDLQMRVFELPCVEVAAPGPDVIGSTVTCQSVLNTYATCQAVLDAQPTCVSLLDLVGDPTDVLVP